MKKTVMLIPSEWLAVLNALTLAQRQAEESRLIAIEVGDGPDARVQEKARERYRLIRVSIQAQVNKP